MYYYLLSSLKRRVILELQDSFSRHPIYNKLAPYIQNRYAFDERPQFGIIVKGSSASKVALSGDNFLGVVQSHVMLAYVAEPKHPLEWVREDLQAIRDNGNVFPSMPGVYYIEILTAPTTTEPGAFVIDPLLTVVDEPAMLIRTGVEVELQLQQPPVPKTLRLWNNTRFLLIEGKDYTVDYPNAIVHLITQFSEGTQITADYRYAVPSIGPIEFMWNASNSTAIPGVILAFGKRATAGDKVAVVVYPDRVDAANAYGGKFEVSLDLDVIAKDPIQLEEIADLSVMYMWGEKKSVLEFEGIEVVDIGIGGESEEQYDETADTYYFMGSISLQLRADWEIHAPLPLTLSKVTPTKPGTDKPGIVEVINNLYYATTPTIVARRDPDFERLG